MHVIKIVLILLMSAVFEVLNVSGIRNVHRKELYVFYSVKVCGTSFL